VLRSQPLEARAQLRLDNFSFQSFLKDLPQHPLFVMTFHMCAAKPSESRREYARSCLRILYERTLLSFFALKISHKGVASVNVQQQEQRNDDMA
jgi:hypothetical protein